MVLLHPSHDTGPAALDGAVLGGAVLGGAVLGGPVLGGPAMLGMHAAVTLATAVAAALRVLPRLLTPLPADRPLPTCAVPGPDLSARLARVLAVACSRRGPPVGC